MTSSNNPLAFTGLMPGFDFMRQFTQAAAGQSAAPSLAGWIAPTVSIEEIDKRIADLKAVQFWLEQHGHTLRATVQALEVQKMTLAALQGMNVNLADIAKAFAAPVASAGSASPESAPETVPKEVSGTVPETQAETANPASPAVVDPLQWWGALTQQFQGIAANVLREAAQAVPPASTRPTRAARKSAAKPAVKRAASRKPAPPATRRGAA